MVDEAAVDEAAVDESGTAGPAQAVRSEHSRELAQAAMALMDDCWDDEVGLLRSPHDDLYQLRRGEGPIHLVRESAHYALGLLMRGGPADRARAEAALAAVLTQQYDEPGAVFHGTWARAPQEPQPPADPVEWRHYDPNWREFVATTFSLVLDDFGDQLPDPLVAAVQAAIERAIEGTLRRDVPARYTNIALMRAYLLDVGGRRFERADWARLAEEQAAEVHELFAREQAFEEYNSPTYYGVNLYALALWRRGARSPLLRELGAEMEAALWRDVARFYHAGLRNVCGPFDRAYDMDMTRYYGYLGLWIWAVVGRQAAPVPPADAPLAHAWDLCPGVAIALLGSRPPQECLDDLAGVRSERTVERIISHDPERVATAWLAPELMIGAQRSAGSGRRSTQYHPVTMHWADPAGGVGWLRVRGRQLDARAAAGRISVVVSSQADPNSLTDPNRPTEPQPEELLWELSATWDDPVGIERDRWELGGLTLDVHTDAQLAEVRASESGLLVSYRPPAEATAQRTPWRIDLIVLPQNPTSSDRDVADPTTRPRK